MAFHKIIDHECFDFYQAEANFSPARPVSDDQDLLEQLEKRNDDLKQTDKEKTACDSLLANILEVLGEMQKSEIEHVEIEEWKTVGALAKSTMVKGQNEAAMVVVLKNMPTVQSLNNLAETAYSKMKSQHPKDAISLSLKGASFEVAVPSAAIQVLVATLPANIKTLAADKHLEKKLMVGHLAAIRHARWFEENASDDRVRAMVRILLDLRGRFHGFQHLTPWVIDLFSHFCVFEGLPESNLEGLPLNKAFRRSLRLLAAGIFLPGSAGISDPCENGNVRCHLSIRLEAQDQLCCTAQTLLRVLAHGGYKQILGYAGNSSIATEMSVWDGVVVTASEKAYDREDETETIYDMEQ